MPLSVVHFYDENTVEGVPDFWFNSYNTCTWPLNNSLVKFLIEKREKSNKKHFVYFNAREYFLNGKILVSNLCYMEITFYVSFVVLLRINF